MALLSPLLRGARKHSAKAVVGAVMALPLVFTFVGAPAINTEQRALAPAPALPASAGEVFKLPPAIDAWINDHFGWRRPMVQTYARLRHDVFHRFPTNQVSYGKDGRLFLAAHNVAGEGESFTAIKSACGWQFSGAERLAGEIVAFRRAMAAKGIAAKLLIVPSAPIVYAEQLPDWQARRCAAAGAPAYAVMASPLLDAQARADIMFPLQQLRAMRGRGDAFPLNNFHWSGAGPRLVAGLTQEKFWGRPASGGTPIPLVVTRKPSDVHYLFPGIERDADVGEPDMAGTTMTSCAGPDCFPAELRTTMAHLASPVGRYSNSAPGLAPRLVMVTDSFGMGAAPWFARYYSEVVYLSSNAVSRATPDEIAKLKPYLFRPDSKDEVLYLYHDVTFYMNRVAYDLGFLRP